MYIILVILLSTTLASAQPGKCDQTPPQATILTPSENKGLFKMTIDSKGDDSNIYRPDQTYILILTTSNTTRPFRWFMITVEDPDIDKGAFEFDLRSEDVGSLKTTNRQARYSERCYNSVENTDNSDKYRVEIHWVSPKQYEGKEKVRLRAMIAENGESWYVGENLTIELKKDDQRALDSPPFDPVDPCNLCSEARYEVIFKGRWSRMSHPLHYPSRPDDNSYSHMVGASHAYKYLLWKPGDKASLGLKRLAEDANVTEIEREIIKAMSKENGTRTLIRGKRRRHPHMFEPAHSLFRVDRVHHLFSLVVAMKPSPDWFLGVYNFELCTKEGWLEDYEIPLYPWDAGTMDGVSYESPRSVTQPVDNVERVAVGSFDADSPFYQLNLNDLKAFAKLQVTRLDVYPLVGVDCEGTNEEGPQEEGEKQNAENIAEPLLLESRQYLDQKQCALGKWNEWSPCVPDSGNCGPGTQLRTRNKQRHYNSEHLSQASAGSCQQDQDGALIQSQYCFVNCT
ncbi:spondin-2-like isoform X1 [Danaus plexippus]|uniref:spondin-2-like isoform X1 n=2 Tax=Danaus plexippus TaxID=13037 RepID=UPI002AB12F46|nr:spondin-2-like isoform X1 [Danaus plexippus]